MTEEEARTKWCPFSRYSGDHEEPAANRWKQRLPEKPYAMNAIPCRCIGSACMAWRWSDVPPPAGPAWKLTEGYCGLAGKP